MKQAREWIDFYRRFWEGSLDSLADYLERGVTKDETNPANSNDNNENPNTNIKSS